MLVGLTYFITPLLKYKNKGYHRDYLKSMRVQQREKKVKVQCRILNNIRAHHRKTQKRNVTRIKRLSFMVNVASNKIRREYGFGW